MEHRPKVAHTAGKSSKGEPTFCIKCGTLMAPADGPTLREGGVMILMKDSENPARTLYIAPGPGGDVGDAVSCDEL